MKKLISLLCALALVLGLSPAARAVETVPTFSDVPPDAWYAPGVAELARLGAVSGYEDGTFRPDQDVTLAELMAMALKAMPPQGYYDQTTVDALSAELAQINGNYWANPVVAQALLLEINDFGESRARWDQPATREEMVYLLVSLYASCTDSELSYYNEAIYLMGDYYTQVMGLPYEPYVLWMYSNGVIAGVNDQGDFNPQGRSSRSQTCTLILSLLHPENWKQVDWESVIQQAQQPQPAVRLEDGTDFKGKSRIRYDVDVAYELCRELEVEIGIQIFYLPEWTQKQAGLIGYDAFDGIRLDSAYFQLVLQELRKMKAAYDLYPQGFLKQMAEKKGSRTAEIILCPYTFPGYASYGVHVYDYSSDAKKVDQIYYTGSGSSQYYSHEMGHMVMSCAAILNGWNDTCSTWEAFNQGAGSEAYVSAYAMSSRPEDWAETWSYLWHQSQSVMELCRQSPALLEKVRYMTRLLDKCYSTFDASSLPWSGIL